MKALNHPIQVRAGFNLLLKSLVLLAGFSFAAGAATVVSSFQAGGGSWQLGTLAVGNLDNDPQLEIVVPYRNGNQWTIDAYKANGTRLPGFPYLAGTSVTNVSPTLADVDGDGKPEILFTVGPSVVALKANGTVLWQHQVNYNNYVPDGGYQVVPGTFYWSGNGQQIARLPSTAIFYSEVSPPLVADVDGDGRFEVITAWKIDPDSTSSNQDFNPFINDIYGSGEWGTVGDNWSGGVIVQDALTGARKFVYHIHQLIESGLAVGKADDNHQTDVYVLNDSDSVVAFDMTQPHGFYGKGMLHKQFGKNQRLQSGTYQLGVDIYAADIDGDGRDEVLVPTREVTPLWQPHETILDDDGTILWRRWKSTVTYTNSNGWENSACMIPCNPDHDNHVDVLSFCQSSKIYFRYWNGSELVDRPGWPIDFGAYLPTPPVVGDVDGDGQEEIIIGTYLPGSSPSSGGLYVYGLDGTLKQSLTVAGGLKHIPFLADVNNDGVLDVVYRSMSGLVSVVDFGPGNPNMVSWASHRGNAARNGRLTQSLFPAGTPLVTSKSVAYRKATLTWETPEGYSAQGFTVRRATSPQGPFSDVASLPASTLTYTDTGLEEGRIYFYEIDAGYATGHVRSSPVAVTPTYNGNLLVNSGFEENNDSHWDKWYTGSIPWQNMHESNVAFEGAHSMVIDLQNVGNNSSIKQFNQYGIPDSSVPVTPGKYYSFGADFKSGGLSQNSEHWLEWNSAKTGTDTNTRPTLPFPNYFTPHMVLGTSPSNWTYANRVFQMPAGFPNIELRHRFTVSGTATGPFYIDNMFFREIKPPTDPAWQQWVSLHSTWKYFNVAGGAVPPSDWFQSGFNDSGWPTGTAKFGAGSGPTGVSTTLPAKQPKYYFRKQFNVNGTGYEDLLLEATCTDDYGGTIYPLEIYLNGTKLETTGIACVSGTGNTVMYYDLTPYLPLIQNGNNTIGVIVNNTWQTGWDNVAFDVGLKAIASTSGPPPPPLPNVTIAATDASASEVGPDNGTFTITRTGDTSAALAVAYTVGGTATNGVDYNTLSGSATIPAGSASTVVTVTPLTDLLAEGAETVALTLSSNSAYLVGSPSGATVNIADDPPVGLPSVSISATDASASELGPDNGTFTVTRTGDTSLPLSVVYSIGGSASNGTDYTALTGTAVIPAGSASVPVTVTPLTDSLTEGTETVQLTLSVNAAYSIGSPGNATVNIADNPPPLPSVSVSATDASASETGPDAGTYTITRTGATTAALTVAYTMSGTASNGTDYTTLSGSATIPVGSSSVTVSLTPQSDALVEGTETAILNLSANAAYQVGSPSSATVNIADGTSQPVVVTLTALDPSASETGPDAGSFRLSRTGSTAAALTVNFNLGGTATFGVDYTVSGSATIPAGASSNTVMINPIPDSIKETSESVVFTVTGGTGYQVGSPFSATVNISD